MVTSSLRRETCVGDDVDGDVAIGSLPRPLPVRRGDEEHGPAWFATSMLVAAVRGYQGLFRPFLVGTCKFCPSCSEYAIEALHAHGPVRGLWLAVRRVIRCHPFSPGGIDPVPPRAPGRAG